MTLFQRCLRFLNVLAAAYLLVFIPFQIGASADEVGLDVYFFYTPRDRGMDFFDGPRFGILGIHKCASIHPSES